MLTLPLYQVNSKQAYQKLLSENERELSQLKHKQDELKTKLNDKKKYYIDGTSWPIKSSSQFLMDNQYGIQNTPNWRERLVCKKTGLNNRIRGAIHVFESFCKPNKKDAIYLTEQLSPLYQWLTKNYQNTVGSEFISASSWINKIRFKLKLFPHQLHHQDLTDLDCPNERFQYVLSFDCFEHIPDYTQAFSEIFRILKPSGQLLFSVPFNVNADDTIIRASIDEQGETTFHVEPEYHGNPMSKEGSLSYYTFGWDLLDTLKSVGFSEAYALVYWSKKYMYLGGPQLLLCAEK